MKNYQNLIAAVIVAAAVALPATAQEGVAGAAQDLWNQASAARNFVADALDPPGSKVGLVWHQQEIETGAIAVADNGMVRVGGLELEDVTAGLVFSNSSIQTGRITADENAFVAIGDLVVQGSTLGGAFITSTIDTGALTARRGGNIQVGRVVVR